MAKNDRRSQKKKERRTAKRKEKRKSLVKRADLGVMQLVRKADEFPIRESFLSEDVFTQGIGYAVLARTVPGGRIAFANLLIDSYCLGVKRVYLDVVALVDYEEMVRQLRQRCTLLATPPAEVFKYVEGAVAYAKSFGLSPDEEYADARLLFAGLDPDACTETFTYGDRGKPHYVNGPHDSAAFARRVLAKLKEHAGEGNYEFSLMGDEIPPELLGLAAEDDDDYDDEDEDDDIDDRRALPDRW